MNVRHATLADVAAINRLSGDMGYKIVSPSTAGKRVGGILESNLDRLWVAEEAGCVKGWIHVFVAKRAGS